jgi:hypothetical protein
MAAIFVKGFSPLGESYSRHCGQSGTLLTENNSSGTAAASCHNRTYLPGLELASRRIKKETARRSGLHLIRDLQVHRKTDFLIGRIDAALEVRRIAIDPLDVVSEKLLVPAASTLRGLRSKKDGT